MLSLTRAGSGTRRARSLERYGQLLPVAVCRRQDCYDLIDGFKWLAPYASSADPASVGRVDGGRFAHGEGGHLRTESCWWPHAGTGRSLDHPGALVREDGLSQVDKSWVCRRLALIEGLGPKAKDVRLAQGNQTLAGCLEATNRCTTAYQRRPLLHIPPVAPRFLVSLYSARLLRDQPKRLSATVGILPFQTKTLRIAGNRVSEVRVTEVVRAKVRFTCAFRSL
jgi:hypothetical protein